MYGDLKKTGSDKRYTLNLWFIKLRWIAVAISFILIYLADYHFHYLEKGSFWPLIFIVSFLSLINIIYKILLIKRIFFNF